MEMFILLGKHGTSIKKRIELSFKNAGLVFEQLEQGKELTDILCSGKGPYFTIMALLCRRMSFEKAHVAAVQYCERSHNVFRTIFSKSVYSLFVFLFSFFMIYFFSDLIYPQMAVYAKEFGPVLFLLKGGMNGLAIGLLCFFLFLFYIFYLPCQKVVERQIGNFPFMKKLVSIQLASVLLPFFDTSLSTREALRVCLSIKENNRLRLCIAEISKRLESGCSLLEAMEDCDPELVTFAGLGMESMNMKGMFEMYLLRSKKQTDRLIEKIVRIIQMISYGCVGLLVFTAYQILLSPLNVLYTI
ncbi:type II secretion system F family protein [uncultured Dubosiella sp.]|nr:type II secretion system F family protein [uncultured Dubosiella sp.]